MAVISGVVGTVAAGETISVIGTDLENTSGVKLHSGAEGITPVDQTIISVKSTEIKIEIVSGGIPPGAVVVDVIIPGVGNLYHASDLADTTKLATIGDSVPNAVWGSVANLEEHRAWLISQGIDFPIKDYAAAGATLATVGTQATQVNSDFNRDTNLLVVVQAGMQELTTNGDYTLWTQAQKDAFTADYTSLLDTLTTTGGLKVCVTPLTHRSDLAVQGLNQDLIYPLIQSYSPDYWDAVNSKPLVDTYQASFDMQTATADYLAAGDSLLPSTAGQHMLAQYILGKIDTVETLPLWDKRVRVTISCRGNNTDATIPPNVNIMTSLGGPITNLVDSRGNVIAGSSYSNEGYILGSSAAVSEPSNLYPDSSHFALTGHYVYRNSATGEATNVITLGQEFAWRSGFLLVTGTRAVAGNHTTATAAGFGSESYDPSAVPPQQTSIPFKLGPNGELTFTTKPTPDIGSAYSYFSSATLVLSPPRFKGNPKLATPKLKRRLSPDLIQELRDPIPKPFEGKY